MKASSKPEAVVAAVARRFQKMIRTYQGPPEDVKRYLAAYLPLLP